MRASQKANVKMYAEKFGCAFVAGKKPWEVKADICIPCATQNEVDLHEAEKMVQNGTQFYFEGANMPATNEAIAYLQNQGVLVGPAKAANAGGVAVSALEMSQNSERIHWSKEEVDAKLKEIMFNIVDVSYQASKRYGHPKDLVIGANIAGFEKVAEAMMAQGLI